MFIRRFQYPVLLAMVCLAGCDNKEAIPSVMLSGEPEIINPGEEKSFPPRVVNIPASYSTVTVIKDGKRVVERVQTSEAAERVVLVPPLKRTPYVAKLSVTDRIRVPGSTGQMLLAISAESSVQPTNEGFASAQSSAFGTDSRWATIEPFAPDFDVEPLMVSCINLDPQGSETRFVITPKITAVDGDYLVSANVLLFDSKECDGNSTPKTTRNLSVKIEIDRWGSAKRKLRILSDMTWSQFVKFFGAVLVLVFGALLFLMRKKINKWIGRDQSGENQK